MPLGYAFQIKEGQDATKIAKAKGVALPISNKHSYEVCKYLRHKLLPVAMKHLEEVIILKRAVPYGRFDGDLAHKKTMAAGRYPVKTAEGILELLKSVEANARFKGLNTHQLEIIHLHAHQASRPFRYGRQTRRKMKRTHIEIVVQEKAALKQEVATSKKKETKEAHKTH